MRAFRSGLRPRTALLPSLLSRSRLQGQSPQLTLARRCLSTETSPAEAKEVPKATPSATSTGSQSMEFQAETKRLLSIVANSL